MKDKSVMWGTCNFTSRLAARDYYKPQGLTLADIDRKIKFGEILIGKPIIKLDEILYLKSSEGRYFIGAK